MQAGLPDAIGKMKQFACWFTHGVRNGAELRRQVHTAHTTQEVLDRVDAFFAASAPPAGRGVSERLAPAESPHDSARLRSTQTSDARRERRIRVRLPVEVRGTDRSGARFDERTTSEDVCRAGRGFALSRELEIGSTWRSTF